MIHERFCCNRGFAAATSLSAGLLAAQFLNVLLQILLGSSRLCLPVSLRDATISERIVMNHAGDMSDLFSARRTRADSGTVF